MEAGKIMIRNTHIESENTALKLELLCKEATQNIRQTKKLGIKLK